MNSIDPNEEDVENINKLILDSGDLMTFETITKVHVIMALVAFIIFGISY